MKRLLFYKRLNNEEPKPLKYKLCIFQNVHHLVVIGSVKHPKIEGLPQY